MRVSRLFLFVLLALSCVAPAAGKRWALVVGIDSYQDPGLNSLHYSVADAKLMSRSLSALGFERVVVLTSDATDPLQQPTRGNILDRLSQIASSASAQDTVLIYFSGHGFSDDKTSYLSTQDCRPSLLEETAISMQSLQGLMKRMKALHRVFVVDACRNDPYKLAKSGSEGRTDGFSKNLIEIAQGSPTGQSGTAILWACSIGEQSWEDPKDHQGAFTYFLAQGLQSGQARESDGSITPYSLITFVQDKMQSWSLTSGKKQTPDYNAIGKAKFSIGIAKAATGKANPKATLTVGSSPTGATVIIDGEPAGKTPYTASFVVDPGSERKLVVTLSLDGFYKAAAMATLRPGGQTPVDLILTHSHGITKPTEPNAAAKGNSKFSNKGNIEMLFVPAGEFKMGGDKTVAIYLDAYYIGKNDVTSASFGLIAGTRAINLTGLCTSRLGAGRTTTRW